MRAKPVEIFEAIQKSWKYALVSYRNIEELVLEICLLFTCRKELHNFKRKPNSLKVFSMQQPERVEVDSGMNQLFLGSGLFLGQQFGKPVNLDLSWSWQEPDS